MSQRDRYVNVLQRMQTVARQHCIGHCNIYTGSQYNTLQYDNHNYRKTSNLSWSPNKCWKPDTGWKNIHRVQKLAAPIQIR